MIFLGALNNLYLRNVHDPTGFDQTHFALVSRNWLLIAIQWRRHLNLHSTNFRSYAVAVAMTDCIARVQVLRPHRMSIAVYDWAEGKGLGLVAVKGGRRISLYRNVACSAKRARFNIVYKLFSAEIAISIQIGSPRTSRLPVGRIRYFV